MLRITLVLAGTAIALGVAHPAEPATADATSSQPLANVAISEIGIDLLDVPDPDGQLISGSFIELQNTTSNMVSVSGYSLFGCDETGIFEIVEFGLAHVIDPSVGPFFLVANQTYSDSPGGDREDILDDDADRLVQSVGGLVLLDDSFSVVDSVTWGTGVPPDCSTFAAAANTPTATQSIDRATATPFDRADPTPESQSGDK